MKIQKFAMLSMMLCSVTMLQAQDVIVKHDGSTILSKVIKIGTAEVEYKKFSNQNGPTYTILKSDIQAINYENGDKDSFNDVKQQAKEETSGKQQIVVATPASDNAEIISRYNRNYEHGEAIKDKDKPATEGLCILGVGEQSTLSSEDIIVEFRQEPYIIYYNLERTALYDLMKRYKLVLHNKTDNILYVDLGRTFRVMKDGSSYTYYDNSQTTITKGSGSGASVNLGAVAGAAGIGGTAGTLANGVSVGGGNSASSSKTYTKQRVILIPPHGRVPLEEYKIEVVKFGGLGRDKYEVLSEGELLKYGFNKGQMPDIKRGEIKIYSEEESPYHVVYTIIYSKNSEFTNAHSVKVSAYMRELIGSWQDGHFWDFDWTRARSDPQKKIDKMREYIPDYNDYTIVGVFGYAHKAR